VNDDEEKGEKGNDDARDDGYEEEKYELAEANLNPKVLKLIK
jgi:hypothetical protein